MPLLQIFAAEEERSYGGLLTAVFGIKDIYVYPLGADFRQKMGVSAEPAARLRPLAVEEGLGAKEWAQQEFGEVELGDQRLRDRLIRIVEDRAEHPDASYLEAAGGDRYAAKGYYYFIDSPRDSLHPEAMLATHRKRTMQRMRSHPVVLVVQDTTDLNFSTRPQTTGLGLAGTNQTGAQSLGLKLHSSVVLTPDGLPLGILRSVADAPEEKGLAGKKSVGRPMEEKKSFRWLPGLRDCVAVAKQMPQTRLLMVADREADLFELLAEAEATRKRVGVLVSTIGVWRDKNRNVASESSRDAPGSVPPAATGQAGQTGQTGTQGPAGAASHLDGPLSENLRGFDPPRSAIPSSPPALGHLCAGTEPSPGRPAD